jgi:hypothetical protein
MRLFCRSGSQVQPTLYTSVYLLTSYTITDISLACTMLRMPFGYPTKIELYGSEHSLL